MSSLKKKTPKNHKTTSQHSKLVYRCLDYSWSRERHAMARSNAGLGLGAELRLSADANWKAFFQHCRQTDPGTLKNASISSQTGEFHHLFFSASDRNKWSGCKLTRCSEPKNGMPKLLHGPIFADMILTVWEKLEVCYKEHQRLGPQVVTLPQINSLDWSCQLVVGMIYMAKWTSLLGMFLLS